MNKFNNNFSLSFDVGPEYLVLVPSGLEYLFCERRETERFIKEHLHHIDDQQSNA